jgi:hypothetical protein
VVLAQILFRVDEIFGEGGKTTVFILQDTSICSPEVRPYNLRHESGAPKSTTVQAMWTETSEAVPGKLLRAA